MNRKYVTSTLILVVSLGLLSLVGCNPDKSGDTQQMPASASTAGSTASGPAGATTAQGQKAIQSAAPGAHPIGQ